MNEPGSSTSVIGPEHGERAAASIAAPLPGRAPRRTLRGLGLLAPRAIDLGLVGAAVLAGLIESALRDPPHIARAGYLLVLVAAVPLAFRRSHPLRVLLTSAAGAVLCAALLHASWTVTGCVAVALYTVALLGDRRRSLLVGVATSVLVIVVVLVIDGTVDAEAMFTRLALIVLCVAAGEIVRTREELRAARAEAVARQVREHADQLRRAAFNERLTIARELHDTLGHFLVAINVRAGVAVEVPETQDPIDALVDIKAVSASALADLRATLSVLRVDDEPAPTAPAVTLEDLHGVVERACAAGVETELEIDLDGVELPPATTAATTRIVQESLTNVLRHAQATSAAVSIRATRDALEVDVSDNGTATVKPSTEGFGLRGMTERAVALGGQVQAGPRATGGWAVHARLPLTRVSAR